MKNKNSKLAEQSIPDKWISWLFAHNVLFTYQEWFTEHLSSLFPSLPAKSSNLWIAFNCCGLGQMCGFHQHGKHDGSVIPKVVCEWQTYTLLTLQQCFTESKWSVWILAGTNFTVVSTKETSIFLPFFEELLFF